MTELLTAAQMRAIERAAIESGEVTGLELMERAGQGVVEAVFEEWPEVSSGRHAALVFAGPGNNGGDGFVVARLLHKLGWAVEVLFFGEADRLPAEAGTNYQRWLELGPVQQISLQEREEFLDQKIVAAEARLANAVHIGEAVIIHKFDALFGTGLTRAIDEPGSNAARVIWWMSLTRTIAIDLPSGLCADSGRVLSSSAETAERVCEVGVDLTVTFQEPRIGHHLASGPSVCNRLKVADIGLPVGGTATYLTFEDPDLGKEPGHKYTHGHAFILSGGPGRGGAARLAARGALRIGAGLVTLGCPPEALTENAARLDAIMLREIGDAGVLAEILKDARITTLCLGPALGVRDEKVPLLEAALQSGRSCVLDADALTLIAADPALFALLHPACVLTPHGGEFARLFPDIAEKLAAPATKGPAYSKVDATREAAARAGCTVLFKGPDTVIASPDGTCAINASQYERAAPWLATAGSGDVLAGFITGLLARGFTPQQAAETGAWLHTECALSFGPGLIAEDLPEELPKVFRDLLA